MDTIAKRLKAVLDDKGWNRGTAAEKTGVAESSIQRYLSGYTQTIPSDKLIKLSKGLGVPVDYLLGQGAFSSFDAVVEHRDSFIYSLNGPYGLSALDKNKPVETSLCGIIAYIDTYLVSAQYDGSGWNFSYKENMLDSNSGQMAGVNGTDYSKMFGERLRNQRILHGLTQEQLGERTGFQKSAIAKYENGRIRNISIETVYGFAEALGVDVAELLRPQIGVSDKQVPCESEDRMWMTEYLQSLPDEEVRRIRAFLDPSIVK